jgi:hypothetical protein
MVKLTAHRLERQPAPLAGSRGRLAQPALSNGLQHGHETLPG